MRFPGRAGQLQGPATRPNPALLAELANNYAGYNRFLAREWARLRVPPNPADYQNDIHGFLVALDQRDDVLRAEGALRKCVASQRGQADLGAPPDPSKPFLDDRNRLLSVETGQPLSDDAGADPVPPPAMPDWAAAAAGQAPRR
jgi:hypothetical protein